MSAFVHNLMRIHYSDEDKGDPMLSYMVGRKRLKLVEATCDLFPNEPRSHD
ncbi:hypothetical protein J2857_005343 [Neorhizobium galegae]|nr:hypothetical protein [Neorhizobium galegae]